MNKIGYLDNQKGNIAVMSIVIITIGMVVMLILYSLFSVYIAKGWATTGAEAAALQAAKVLQDKFLTELDAKKRRVLDKFWNDEVYPLARELQDDDTTWEEAVEEALGVLLENNYLASIYYDNQPPKYPSLKYVWQHPKFADNFTGEANGELLMDTSEDYAGEIFAGAQLYADKNGMKDLTLYFPLEGVPKIAVETQEGLWFPLYKEKMPSGINGVAAASIAIKIDGVEFPIDVSDYDLDELGG